MKNKKNFIFIVIAAVTLITVVLGATYAFFVAQGGGSSNANVDVQTNTTDNLSFEVGNPINLNVTQDNFYQGAGNQAGSTTASATLTANNATNSATRNYYLYLDITDNDFEYTVDTTTPELILTIETPDGTELQTLSGYKYVEVGEVSGFDITTVSDVIKIADNYEITSTGTETQTWNITVTFVNLDSDQVGNTGKTFESSLIIQAEPLQTRANLASYITDTLYTADGVNNLYYHDGIGSYKNASEEAGDNSYRFSGGDYQVTETAIGEGLTRVYTTINNESDGVINFYCNGEKQVVGYMCVATSERYYTTAYNESIHYNLLEEALFRAVTDGYLTSDNIKNFVCFGPGSEYEMCSEDNLYRIIGVFNNQVKLIKYSYANTTLLGEDGAYSETDVSSFWSSIMINEGVIYRYNWSVSSDEWSYSELNKINLNNNYWNYLGSGWQSVIANTTWKVGGNTWDNINNKTVKHVYQNEVVSPLFETTYEDEIGLMYISDYMYAVSPTGWLNLSGYNLSDYRFIKDDNWMYLGGPEWTITKELDNENMAFGILNGGDVGRYNNYENIHGIRPVFYLNSDVEIYEGHAGTQSDPYRIVI